MDNLHRITGSQHMRFKPGLCPTCKFLVAGAGPYDFDRCSAHGKKLSAPKAKTKKGRCSEFEPDNSHCHKLYKGQKTCTYKIYLIQ